jgi:hypothetical protein
VYKRLCAYGEFQQSFSELISNVLDDYDSMVDYIEGLEEELKQLQTVMKQVMPHGIPSQHGAGTAEGKSSTWPNSFYE